MTTPDRLAKWLDDNGASQVQFCRDSGISESHLSLFLKGKRGVSFRMAKRISEATGGVVPIEALVVDRDGAPACEAAE